MEGTGTRRGDRAAVRVVASVAGCCAVSFTVSQLARADLEFWYPTQPKPAWAPPNAVFPAAWTACAMLLGIAFALAIAKPRIGPLASVAFVLFNLAAGGSSLALFVGHRFTDAAMLGILAIAAALVLIGRLLRHQIRTAILVLAPTVWFMMQTALCVQMRNDAQPVGPRHSLLVLPNDAKYTAPS